MFPLRDNIPSRRFPLVTVFLISLFIYVFYLELKFGYEFVLRYSLIPANVNFTDISTLAPFITSIFLHGSWLHLVVNVWFLWIFGDNVEDMFGRVGYFFLFILWGIIASLAQYFAFPSINAPNLGASGAIAGVLGSYLIFFPKAKVKSLLLLFIFVTFIEVRAVTLLVFWFILQILGGIYLPEMKGIEIAYFAHIGGFLGGIVTALAFKILKKVKWL